MSTNLTNALEDRIGRVGWTNLPENRRKKGKTARKNGKNEDTKKETGIRREKPRRRANLAAVLPNGPAPPLWQE